MTAGAATVAPGLCKVEGCGGRIVGRRMCDKHYRRWRRVNPGLTMMAMTQQTVLECMPATIPTIIDKTGMGRETVLRALVVLNVAGPDRQAYIYRWEPPECKGKNWQPVYRQGSRANKRLTKAEKLAHTRQTERAWRVKFRGVKPKQDPLPSASWTAVLGV